MRNAINQPFCNKLPLGFGGSPRFALVKFGAGITQMSGAVGGSVFARNRSGNYIRARTKPINPNTSLQQAVRATMTFLTDRWAQTLTAAQRTAWNLYASSVVMKNRLGENIFLTGFNHYIRSNSILITGGGTAIDEGPTIFELPAKDPTFSITASEATQKITISFDTTLNWSIEDGGVLYIFQGQPQNGQRNFFGGPWRKVGARSGVDPGGAASPVDMPVVFAIAENQRQWVRVRIQRADGRLSEPFRADIAVGA